MDDDKLLLAQAEDLIGRCAARDIPACSGFLDARQQSILRKKFGERQGDVTIAYSGGYDDADRVVMACLPYYMDGTYFDDVLTVIRASVPKNSEAARSGRALSHSDYLGALMGLGISRSVTGDILVNEGGADIIVLKDMAEFLLQNLTGAGRARISAEEVPLSELRIPEQTWTEAGDTVASLRLDAVLASAFRMSRGKAAEAVRQGLVFVDHMEAGRPDMTVSEGAELVIRHKGKAKLLEVGRRTKKDRIGIRIARYEKK